MIKEGKDIYYNALMEELKECVEAIKKTPWYQLVKTGDYHADPEEQHTYKTDAINTLYEQYGDNFDHHDKGKWYILRYWISSAYKYSVVNAFVIDKDQDEIMNRWLIDKNNTNKMPPEVKQIFESLIEHMISIIQANKRYHLSIILRGLESCCNWIPEPQYLLNSTIKEKLDDLLAIIQEEYLALPQTAEEKHSLDSMYEKIKQDLNRSFLISTGNPNKDYPRYITQDDLDKYSTEYVYDEKLDQPVEGVLRKELPSKWVKKKK